MSTADKLNYLLETKNRIKTALINKGASVDDNTPFREYASAIDNIGGADGEVGKPYIDTSKITNFSHFCYEAVRLDILEKTDTSNGEIFDYMFADINLTFPPALPKTLNTSKGKSFVAMFQSCLNYTELPSINTENATNLSSLYNACSRITQIDTLDTRNCTNFSGLFSGCNFLSKIPPIDTSKGTKFTYMFYSCDVLETVTITTAKSDFSSNSFQKCYALKNLTIGEGWAVSIYVHYSNNLTVESLHGMVENLADLTGQTAKTFKIGSTNLAKIDEEHITMLQNKNWNYS